MKSFILRMQRGKDNAKLLITAAFALAHYRTTTTLRYSEYPDELTFNNYVIETQFLDPLPERTAPCAEHGYSEYVLPAGMIDVTLLEIFAELQTLIPFEMYFENRGCEYGDEPEFYSDEYHDFTIHDDAIYSLYNSEPAIHATPEQIKKWRASQMTKMTPRHAETPKTRAV